MTVYDVILGFLDYRITVPTWDEELFDEMAGRIEDWVSLES